MGRDGPRPEGGQVGDPYVGQRECVVEVYPPGPRRPLDAAVVRAQRRRTGAWCPGLDRVAAIRHPRRNHAGLRFDEHPPLHEVVDRLQGGRGGDGGHRNPERGRELHDLLRGAGQGPFGDHADEFVAAPDPAGERRQLGVVDKVGTIDHHQEVLKLLRGDGAEADHAVGGGDDRRQFQTAMLDKGFRAQHTGRHGGQAAHRDRHRLVGRDVHDLAAATPGGVPRGGGTDRRGEGAREPFTEPAPRLDGFVIRPAPAGDRTRQRLQDEFVGDDLFVDVGARQPERRYGHDHSGRSGVRGDVREAPPVAQVG